MSTRMKALGLLLFIVALTVAPVLAQETGPQNNGPREGMRDAMRTAQAESKASLYKLSLIVAGGIITLAVIAGAFCQAKAISAACEGISRNPGGAPHIRFLLLLGLILIETLVIYALLVTFIILMVKWGNYA
jgi:F-type H+-transporting ATPase subunit c